MGIRGVEELVAVLPPAAAEPASAVARGLSDLLELRHATLAPEGVRALGELWERFTAQASAGRLGVLAAIDARDDVIPKAKVGDAGAVFACHGLGQRRGTARRDAAWAGLLRPQVGTCPRSAPPTRPATSARRTWRSPSAPTRRWAPRSGSG